MKKPVHNKTVTEKLYLQGIPRSKVGVVEQAVDAGLMLAKESLHKGEKIDITIYLTTRANENRRDIMSRGNTSLKSIDVGVSRKYIDSKGLLENLTSTIAHEYVHLIRLRAGKHQADTVLGMILEEGLAIYIQAALTKTPEYLDIKTLNERMVRVCWSKFSAIVDEPSKKYPEIESDDTYRTASYRLGFGIIRKFMKQNPKMNLERLVMVSNKKMRLFTKNTFGKIR